MAQTSSIAMALATPTPSVDIPVATGMHAGFSTHEKLTTALLTPPNSMSPDMPAQASHQRGHSVPSIDIGTEAGGDSISEHSADLDDVCLQDKVGTPLSRGALSGLDAAAAITPSMLAKHHLPGIMLGAGPRPIRFVMGELTHCVPGFSRIPPAKARRLVVAALENRNGGGVDGNISFSKTGWGRWDAHVKGSSRDSGVGSFPDGHLSPPQSERGSYAMSHGDSAVHMPGPRLPSRYRDQRSGGSWTASSFREEDELEMDLDIPEDEADKMSLDGASDNDDSIDDATDDDDWAAVGPEVLRKASLPTPGAPRRDYNAISAAYSRRWPTKSWNRRPSGVSERPRISASLPTGGAMYRNMDQSMSATPEEQAAAAALLSMGSM